jgi:hypothetical protein
MDSPQPSATSSNVSAWYSIFINTVGFMIGFIVGGVTGYFGNWLWYRFGPSRKTPHFTMTTLEGSTSFSGLMTGENQESILKSLKAVKIKKLEALSVPDISLDPNSNTS